MSPMAVPHFDHHHAANREPPEDAADFNASTITRPDPTLATYYVIVSLLTTVGFPFVILPLLCKYYTLRYQFDDTGVSVRWGVLFRREVYLNYRRIQDIHVTRNLIQRWMGLATISIQTASGSASPVISIEGILQPELLRDYLYGQMRGAKGEMPHVADVSEATRLGADAVHDEALVLLREIRDELRRVTGQRGRS